MDPEQQKKRQTLRILFSEAMMVLSVIIIMTVLIMITSGYWINQNFEVERRGMLEVFSAPTGADIISHVRKSPAQWKNCLTICAL